VPPRLAELADLANVCREAFHGVAAASHWRPAAGSSAAVAQAALAGKDPAKNSDGIFAGFDLVSEVVVTYLVVAAGHLGGLAALYRNGEAMFPPLPLVRSVIEYCSHAMWVIGDGTGTADDVLARAYLEEFTSCEFAKIAAGRMGSKDDDAYTAACLRWRLVRGRAIAAFPGATPSDLSEEGGRTLGGQTLVGPEAGARWMFGLLVKGANGSITEGKAGGIYAFLSSGSRPSLYQARQLREPVDHGDHQGTILRVDVGFLERLMGAAVMAFYNALSYAISFYGLPRSAHDTLTAAIDETMPTLFT